MKRALAITLLTVLAATLAIAQSGQTSQSTQKWLHVRVEKTGEDGEFVRVNVPLSLAAAVLPTIQARGMQHGRIRFHRHHDGIDLRALLEAVTNTADGEFVLIEKKDEKIRVAKENGFLLVKIEKRGKKEERVDARVPLIVVEALLSGDEDELNIAAAIKALRDYGDIELVTVRDGKETIRVWIDSKNTGE